VTPNNLTPDADAARILSAATAFGMLGGGPGAAHRLLSALCNPLLGLREVRELVIADPGIAARVLKVANSSFYGRPRHVDTIDRAITLLGLDAVRGVAAAACLDRAVPSRSETGLLDAAALVRHSITAALAAEQLARLRRPQLASEAFIAGLLHDLGAILQARVDPEGFRLLLEALRANPGQALRELESRHVSVSHEQCTGVLFESWQLPAGLIASVRHHHHPLGAPEEHRLLAAFVCLGNHVSVMEGQTFPLEPAAPSLDPAALATTGVREEDLDRVARELPGRIAAFVLPIA
jgi:HD-like signal output (HDOD) protein